VGVIFPTPKEVVTAEANGRNRANALVVEGQAYKDGDSASTKMSD